MRLYEFRVSIIGDQASGVDARFLGSRGRFSDKFGLGDFAIMFDDRFVKA